MESAEEVDKAQDVEEVKQVEDIGEVRFAVEAKKVTVCPSF